MSLRSTGRMAERGGPRVRGDFAARLFLDLDGDLDARANRAARKARNRRLNNADPLSELSLRDAGLLEEG